MRVAHVVLTGDAGGRAAQECSGVDTAVVGAVDLLDLVGQRLHLAAVEREVGSECPVEIFCLKDVLGESGFDAVVFNATLVAGLQNHAGSRRYAHGYNLVVDGGRVVSHVEACAVLEEAQVGADFPRRSHFRLEVECLAYSRVDAPTAVGEARPVLEGVGELVWCAALTHLCPVAANLTVREPAVLQVQQFREDETAGDRWIEVCAVYLTQSRRAVEASGYRHLCNAAIVESQFAEVAEFVPIRVVEIHVVARRRRVGECRRVDVLEAVEITFEHESLTSHLSAQRFVVRPVDTKQHVDVEVAEQFALISGEELRIEAFAARGLEGVRTEFKGIVGKERCFGVGELAFAEARHHGSVVHRVALVVAHLAGEHEVFDRLIRYLSVEHDACAGGFASVVISSKVRRYGG